MPKGHLSRVSKDEKEFKRENWTQMFWAEGKSTCSREHRVGRRNESCPAAVARATGLIR